MAGRQHDGADEGRDQGITSGRMRVRRQAREPLVYSPCRLDRAGTEDYGGEDEESNRQRPARERRRRRKISSPDRGKHERETLQRPPKNVGPSRTVPKPAQ